MTSRSLLDPELAPLVDGGGGAALDAAALPEARIRAPQPPSPLVESGRVRRIERHVPGPIAAPPVRVLLYVPSGDRRRPALLHIHGGGYVLGEPEANDWRNAGLALELDCVVMSVEYRLAPETPFPGAIEDCYAALLWLHGASAALGIDPERIGVIGESAGGGLAASLALLARDRGVVSLRLQALVYPMLDDRTGSTVPVCPPAGEFIWTAASNRFGWSALLGGAPGGPQTSPYASAARAESLAGLPASFIAIGALDLFIAETIDYTRRLIEAGVPSELHIYPGAVHGFDFVGDAEVSRAFTQDLESALGRGLR